MNHGWTYTDRIKPAANGMNVVDFYARSYRHSSAETWKDRILGGEITRNGRPVSPSDAISTGDVLEWRRPPWREPDVPTDFSIVYEDNSIIAVDKPAGLPVVPDGGFLENTLVAFIRDKYPGFSPSPVHRLNRGTSGLVLFGKTREAIASLTAQFRDKTARQSGTMRKTYIAKTVPCPQRHVGESVSIDTPIGPVPHPILGFVHAATPLGKPSQTICKVIGQSPEYTLWEADLVTGRPHQIRIHLASIGAPLLGDPLFLPGGHPAPGALPGQCGYFLRSVSLTFVHPKTHEPMTISV